MTRIPAQSLRQSTALLRSLVGLTLAFLALVASGSAWADPPGRVGRIADSSGNVWLYDNDEGDWVQPRRNRPVTEGDRISAERGARAELQIGSATLRLDGGTDIEVLQLDDERVHVRLIGGSVALRAYGDSAREFAIVTEEGRFEPLRAGRYRVDAKDSGSLGAAITGALRFEARDSVLDINAGQRAEFWNERGATHYAWASMPEDRFGEWVAREERDDDRERERHRYVSPEMTGAEDLDRYGRWDRHPDYGAVWYPTTVSVGWAPYRYGHWAYVSPWGWTWVDDAPWGFAPFHYGRWVSYGGRWGWCPGQYVARPVYSPALVAWFGGSNVSVGISVGGPAVGWVPLSPREIYYPTYQVTNVYVRNVNTPYRHWHGRNPRYERAVPTGPIMYTNQGVAGGVTVVPQGVMRSKQAIANAAVPVDSKTVSRWQAQTQSTQAAQPAAVPVPPPQSRVVATPGGAVPAAPGAVRSTPWTPPGRIGAARGDGGQGPQRAVAPGREPRPATVERPSAAATPPPRPTVQPAAPMPQRDANERRERSRDDDQPQRVERSRDEERGRGRESQPDRRSMQPGVVQPVQPVQPAQVERAERPDRRNAPPAAAQPAQAERPERPERRNGPPAAAQPAQPAQPMQPVQPAQPQRVQPAPAPQPRGQREDGDGERQPRGERGDKGERGEDPWRRGGNNQNR